MRRRRRAGLLGCAVVLALAPPGAPMTGPPRRGTAPDGSTVGGQRLATRDPHGRYHPASTLKAPTLLTLAHRLDPAAVVEATEDDERSRAAGWASMQDPASAAVLRTPSAQVPAVEGRSAGFRIQNQNPLLHSCPGILGGKTGFTDAARHTFVAAAERDGRRLVVSVLDTENVPLRAAGRPRAVEHAGARSPAGARPVRRAAAARFPPLTAVGVLVGGLVVSATLGWVLVRRRRPAGQVRRRAVAPATAPGPPPRGRWRSRRR